MRKILPVFAFLVILISSNKVLAQWKVPLQMDTLGLQTIARPLDVNIDEVNELINGRQRKSVKRRSEIRSVQIQKLHLSPDYHVLEYGANGTPEWVEIQVDLDLRSKNRVDALWDSYKKAFSISGEIELETINVPSLDTRSKPVHQRYNQKIGGLKIYDSEVVLHHFDKKTVVQSKVHKVSDDLVPEDYMQTLISRDKLESILYREFGDIRDLKADIPIRTGILQEELQWYFDAKDNASLVYVIEYMPDLTNHYHVVIDAITGEVHEHFNKVCNFTGDISSFCSLPHKASAEQISEFDKRVEGFLSPVEGIGEDLNGTEYRFPIWSEGNDFYLIDATQPMFDVASSDMPSDPDGAIITLDGQNKSVEDEDFSLFLVGSASNRFSDKRAVSAHVNAILSYQYFLNTFNRNSIDGIGGNILSIVDVLDENSEEMDNAFWNGAAIFYGNGNSDFHSPLSRSLDVGAHELTHGVIQSSGNLRYQGESGALNESFADIFAVLIDRDNWTLGEDVVEGSVFATGNLRDMSDPNNGGRRLGDIGWQPKHVDEQYFGELDEGGVHINSGIPNHVFYLIASQIGKENAEQLYYDVLTNYMTFSSDFKDLRYSVLTAAEGRFGPSSEEYEICKQAFDNVGILEESEPFQPEEGILEENPGDHFMLAISDEKNSMQLINLTTGNTQEIISGEDIYSKPSITDDGSFGVFVDGDFRIQYVAINWNTMELTREYLEDNPQSIWRKIVVSRDGRLIAAVTEDPIDENMYLFNLETGENRTIKLYNPTTSSDFFTTNDVQYIDAMEFDHAGEYILYDAYNEIGDVLGFESANYWDIGLVRVFDLENSSFTEPRVDKIFSNLDDEISVGNPSFSKNDINVFAFDYYDEGEDRNYIGTVNLLTGDAQLIYEGNTIHYPSYTKDDGYILFDSEAGILDEAFEIRAMEMSADRLERVSEDFSLLEDHRWATPFANGNRELIITSAEPGIESANSTFEIGPNPASDYVKIRSLDNAITISEITLFDVKGKRLKWVDFVNISGSFQLSVQGLQPGLYLLHISDKNGKKYIQKLVII